MNHEQNALPIANERNSQFPETPPTTEREFLNESVQTEITLTKEELIYCSLEYRINQILLKFLETAVDLTAIYLYLTAYIDFNIFGYMVLAIRGIITVFRVSNSIPNDLDFVRFFSFISDLLSCAIFALFFYLEDNEAKVVGVITILSCQLIMTYLINCGCSATNDVELFSNTFILTTSTFLFFQHFFLLLKLLDLIKVNWIQALWGYYICLLLMIASAVMISLFVFVNFSGVVKIISSEAENVQFIRFWLILICIAIPALLSIGLFGFGFLFNLGLFKDGRDSTYSGLNNLFLIFVFFFFITGILYLKANIMFSKKQLIYGHTLSKIGISNK